jgi:hypothetical protein
MTCFFDQLLHMHLHFNVEATMRNQAITTGAALFATLATAGAASAQSTHSGDMIIRHGADGQIETALLGPDGPEWGERVATGRLDLGQFPNLTDDPGFDSFSGAFPAATSIGLDLLAALRVWDGDDFEMIDPDFAMSVTKGNSVVTTPAGDATVPGFTFGSADSGGRFHHHVRFFLDPYDASQVVEGLWLLRIQLWSPSPAVLPSEPIFIVFASGADAVAQQQDAVEWVEQNLIGGACNPADLAEPLGLLDLADITAFGAAFSAQDPAADIAAPFGTFDLNDVTAFITAFTAGCP